jgi:catechol 2,3-dioxygenase-like lactoylglutathione lyase family enzyme
MLGYTDAVANLAVKDIARARPFYEDILGLTSVQQMGDEVVVYRSGTTLINVYRSDFAGTNKATAVTWSVGDTLDDIVKALKDKGVRFERYDMPGAKMDGDVHVFGDVRVVWFKDPDGNLLNLVNR